MRPALSLAFVAATMLPALAEPLAIKQPFLSKSTGDETTSLSDAQFVNHGLVGMGRLPADLKDAKGDTLGSFSSMAIDPKSWTHVGISYRGRLYSLADRGYNDPDKGLFFTIRAGFSPSICASCPILARTCLPVRFRKRRSL
jgi:hypothetical protein